MFINTIKTKKIDNLIKSLDNPVHGKKKHKPRKKTDPGYTGARFKPLDNDYTH
jgi:hypothetical protein